MRFPTATSLLLTTFAFAEADSVRGRRQLSGCAQVPTDQYCHLIDKESQMALNIADGATLSGASAVQWEELADRHDNMRFEAAADGRYVIIPEHSNLPLTSAGTGWNDNVFQGDQRTEWCFQDQGDGYFKIKHGSSDDMVFDTVDTSHGASVVLKKSGDGGNQRWRLNCFKSVWEPEDTCVSVPTDKTCHIISKHSQMSLHVQGEVHGDGSNIVQNWESGDRRDDFRFVQTSNGRYNILADESGMGLAVHGMDKGSNVVQSWGKDEWCMVDKGDNYYEIKHQNSGLALDIFNIGSQPNENAIVWEYGDGQDNRLFRLNCDGGGGSYTPPPPSADGCGALDKCLLINIKTKEKRLLESGTNWYSVKNGQDRWTVRCDTRGNMDQVDFFYDDKRHSEWTNPYYMESQSDSWTEPVQYLSYCGKKTIRVSGKTWKNGYCFGTDIKLEAACGSQSER